MKQLSKDLKVHKNETAHLALILREYSDCVLKFSDKFNDHVVQQNTQSEAFVTTAGLTRRRVDVLEERTGLVSRMVEKMVLYIARRDLVSLQGRGHAEAARDVESLSLLLRRAAWEAFCIGLPVGVRLVDQAVRARAR